MTAVRVNVRQRSVIYFPWTRRHTTGKARFSRTAPTYINILLHFSASAFFMSSNTTYDLFFTGRDDPRSCVIIGEDTKPVYFCFETSDRNLMLNVRTIVYKNNKEVCAKLEWTQGNNLGSATVGTREMPMSHLASAGSCQGARSFFSSDGLQFEWRRDRDTPSSYDLYAGSDKPIAVFRRFSQPQSTAVGPAHGLFQYSFTRDNLLVESLVALCINRWIDLHMGPAYPAGGL